MLSKKEQSYINDEQLEAYCKSVSKYAEKGYKFYMSKTETRTNEKSYEPGGAIVFTVDHKNKVEVGYPKIKNVGYYVGVIVDNKDEKKGYISNLDEIYSGNHKDNKLKDIWKDGKFL